MEDKKETSKGRVLNLKVANLDENNYTLQSSEFQILFDSDCEEEMKIYGTIIGILQDMGHTITHFKYNNADIRILSGRDHEDLTINNIRILSHYLEATDSYYEFSYDNSIFDGINSNACILDAYTLKMAKGEHLVGITLPKDADKFGEYPFPMELIKSNKVSAEELNRNFIYLNQTKKEAQTYSVHIEYEDAEEEVKEGVIMTRKEVMDLHKFFYNEKLTNLIIPKNCVRVAIKQGSIVKTEYIRRAEEGSSKDKKAYALKGADWFNLNHTIPIEPVQRIELKPDLGHVNWNTTNMLRSNGVPYFVPMDFQATVKTKDTITTYRYHNVLSIPNDLIRALKEAMCKEKPEIADLCIPELIDAGDIQRFMLEDRRVSKALITSAYKDVYFSDGAPISLGTFDSVIQCLDNIKDGSSLELQLVRVLPYDLMRSLLIDVKMNLNKAHLHIITVDSNKEPIYEYVIDNNMITEEKIVSKTLSSGERLTSTTKRRRLISAEEYTTSKEIALSNKHGETNLYYICNSNDGRSKYYFCYRDEDNVFRINKSNNSTDIPLGIINTASSLVEMIDNCTDYFETLDDINTKIKIESIDDIDIITRICISSGKKKLIVITPCEFTIYSYRDGKRTANTYDVLSMYDAECTIHKMYK